MQEYGSIRSWKKKISDVHGTEGVSYKKTAAPGSGGAHHITFARKGGETVGTYTHRENRGAIFPVKEEVAKPTGDLKKACWKGYTAVGTKKKNGKTVPNCVPVGEEVNQLDEISKATASSFLDKVRFKQAKRAVKANMGAPREKQQNAALLDKTAKSMDRARRIVGEGSEQIVESAAHKKVVSHHAVESVDDGGHGEYFVNLKKGWHWSGQRSFGAKSASEALKFLKHAKQGEAMDEEAKPKKQKHVVTFTITDPNHPAVSMRKRKAFRKIHVNATDRESAINAAKKHYTKLGMKIHDHSYGGVLGEEVEQIDELSKTKLKSYIGAAVGSIEKSASTMTNIRRGMVPGSYESEAEKTRRRGARVRKAMKKIANEEREIPLSHRTKHEVLHYRVLNNGRDVSKHDSYEEAIAHAGEHRRRLKSKGYDADKISVHAYVKEETEMNEVKALPRRHYFDSYGHEKHGIAYTDNKNFWKVENGRAVAHTSDHSVAKGWRAELAARTKQVKEGMEPLEEKTHTVRLEYGIQPGDYKRYTVKATSKQAAINSAIKKHRKDHPHHSKHMLSSNAYIEEQAQPLEEKVFKISLSDAEHQRIRHASMRGGFEHKFTRTGSTTHFHTSKPHRLASDLEKIVPSGETSWKEILNLKEETLDEISTGLLTRATAAAGKKRDSAINVSYPKKPDWKEHDKRNKQVRKFLDKIREKTPKGPKHTPEPHDPYGYGRKGAYMGDSVEVQGSIVEAETPIKVKDNDSRWRLYHIVNKDYEIHHIPRSDANPGELRFKHVYKGKSVHSDWKARPKEIQDMMHEETQIGTVSAEHTVGTDQRPYGVVVKVFKHNKGRGDSYWVTHHVRAFKKKEEAQAHIDRVKKHGLSKIKGATNAAVHEEADLDEAKKAYTTIRQKSGKLLMIPTKDLDKHDGEVATFNAMYKRGKMVKVGKHSSVHFEETDLLGVVREAVAKKQTKLLTSKDGKGKPSEAATKGKTATGQPLPKIELNPVINVKKDR